MARTKDSGGGLDRDFAYLMPFLDKVASTAANFAGPGRDELMVLVDGEKERWQRIQDLLKGAAPPSAEAVDASANTQAHEVELPPIQRFTIGALKR
ncbi:MAG: hypothetical protein ACT4TC_04350 [Myxococcaceae bacterium]